MCERKGKKLCVFNIKPCDESIRNETTGQSKLDKDDLNKLGLQSKKKKQSA